VIAGALSPGVARGDRLLIKFKEAVEGRWAFGADVSQGAISGVLWSMDVDDSEPSWEALRNRGDRAKRESAQSRLAERSGPARMAGRDWSARPPREVRAARSAVVAPWNGQAR
jgi:hypothetical protein